MTEKPERRKLQKRVGLSCLLHRCLCRDNSAAAAERNRSERNFCGISELCGEGDRRRREAASPYNTTKPERLVAVTGADGDLVAALRAAAAENSGAGLGLHTAQEAVSLRTAAAVGLKGTLRHGTELLKGRRRPAGSF